MLRLPIVLPIIVVTAALVAALFVSGFLGGADPASSPRVAVPNDDPAQADAAPNIVVVPHAKDASGDAVELAKARTRAQRSGESPPTDGQSTRPAAKSPSAGSGAGTPAAPPAPAQAPVAPPVAPPPPPPASTQSAANGTTSKRGNATRIDAGSGATGAEQLPASGDTSEVPDLAPPQAGTHP